ncbi:DUF2388 domain-containing protein [Pseudomonas sp. LS-2]|jgi:uncharacterized protein (TIGR02448 family)|uniref:DUF2388 domain-containing protein n=1 Tax=Pseudomonas sp. LS-2 TaxID=2315859 RepID=UPI001404A8A3|nr:DUF2388 domain-containing protein [Pseudomonas sp. LS-2]
MSRVKSLPRLTDPERKHALFRRQFAVGAFWLSLLAPALANDSLTVWATVAGTSEITGWTKDLTTPFHGKRFSQLAVDDAAVFVASDGEIRGPHFERAILELRETVPVQVSDLTIATALISLI